MTDNEFTQAQIWVLPWAKSAHPDWYKDTLAVAGRRSAFESYLLRLCEHRWNEDRESRLSAPIMVLEHTKLTIRVKKNDQVLEFSGDKVLDRQRAIAELAMSLEEWEQFEQVRTEWKLEYEH